MCAMLTCLSFSADLFDVHDLDLAGAVGALFLPCPLRRFRLLDFGL
jgi:hypothetical protein